MFDRKYAQFREPLTMDQLAKNAPSAFATEAASRCSDRYTYIPTSRVIEGLMSAGFVPTFATQSAARTEDRKEHTKHLIRFREANAELKLGELIPEICLVNSHDGTSAYQLFAGLFRPICCNGLMVGSSIEALRVRHSGNVVDNVIDGSFRVISDSKRALDLSQRMGQVMLDGPQRMAFATAAHQLRFEGSPMFDAISPQELLRPRRYQDDAKDVFTTLNVVQENIIKGGVRGHSFDTETGRPRRVRSREVKSIDSNTSLNRALWTLAEKLAENVLHGTPVVSGPLPLAA